MASVAISFDSSTGTYRIPRLLLHPGDQDATWTFGSGEFEIWFPDHISPFRPGDDVSKSGTLTRRIKANTKRNRDYTYRYCIYLIDQDAFVEGTTSPPEMVIE